MKLDKYFKAKTKSESMGNSNRTMTNHEYSRIYGLKIRKAAGFTLAELMVSMSLFSILTTLVLFSFVGIANTRAKTGAMKDSQQKIRMITDQMTRMTKEASSVAITEDPSDTEPTPTADGIYYTLTLVYDETKMGGPPKTPKTVIYLIRKIDLNCTGDCAVSLFREDTNCFFADIPLCTDGNSDQYDMLSGASESGALGLDVNNSLFDWAEYKQDGTPATTKPSFSPPAVRIKLAGKYFKVTREFSDAFTIDTSVIMSDSSYGSGSFATVLTPYTITPSAAVHCSINPGDVQTVMSGGDSVQFSATPSSGYIVDGLYEGVSRLGTGSTYTFVGVTANHTIEARCTLAPTPTPTPTPTPVNLIANGDFTSSFTSWYVQNYIGPSWAIVNEGGNNVLNITHTANGNWTAIGQNMTGKVTSNTNYEITFRYKATAGTTGRIDFRFGNTALTSESTGAGGSTGGIADGIWHSQTINFTTGIFPQSGSYCGCTLPMFALYYDYNQIGTISVDDITLRTR